MSSKCPTGISRSTFLTGMVVAVSGAARSVTDDGKYSSSSKVSGLNGLMPAT